MIYWDERERVWEVDREWVSWKAGRSWGCELCIGINALFFKIKRWSVFKIKPTSLSFLNLKSRLNLHLTYDWARLLNLDIDSVAEWLRRETRNLMGFSRAGSNPAAVVNFYFQKISQFFFPQNPFELTDELSRSIIWIYASPDFLPDDVIGALLCGPPLLERWDPTRSSYD